MSAIPKKSSSLSFFSLNATQFFSAINDNLYKLLLVFLLIHLQGKEQSNTILALAGAIFVIPFILFASLSGTLADRYSKRTLIYITRILEIVIMILGVVAFAYKSVLGGYTVLFLLAFHSTIFSPCKYGILPEIVKKEALSHYNGIMTATTYLAIIFGTALASLLTDLTHKNFVLSAFACIVIALLGALSSLGLKKTAAQAADKKVSVRFITSLLRTFKKTRNRRYLFEVILFGGYFLFMGAYTQLNIIPYTMQSLHLSEVYGGYLFLMTAIGIGFGSFLAGQLSGKEVELGFLPFAALGVASCFFILFLCEGIVSIVMITLFLIGIFGGFYTVPIDAFIQAASPDEDRGQNVAASNFINFFGVVLAAGLLALFGNSLGLRASQGFALMSLLTLLLAILLFFLFLDQVLRLSVAKMGKHFWHIKVEKKSALHHEPTLFIGTRRSWLDTLIVMATLPRLIRYIVPVQRQLRGRNFLYRLLFLIPLDLSYFSPLKELTVEIIQRELAEGHSLCLMQPINHPIHSLEGWEKLLEESLPEIKIPVVPIYIKREAMPKNENSWHALKKLFQDKIVVSYGKKRN